MITELEKSEFVRARPLFKELHMELVVDSVVEGNRFGRIWVDDVISPKTAFMWTGDHRHYIAGQGSDAFDTSLNRLITDVLIPEERDRFGVRYFQLNALSDIWDDKLDVIRTWPLEKRDRVFYVFRRPHAELPRVEASPGFSIERIDRALLSRTSLVNIDTASLALAERVGFEKIEGYFVYFGEQQ